MRIALFRVPFLEFSLFLQRSSNVSSCMSEKNKLAVLFGRVVAQHWDGKDAKDGDAFVVAYDRGTALCTIPLTPMNIWSLAAHLYVVYVNLQRIRYLIPIVRRLHLSPCCFSWMIIFCQNGHNLKTEKRTNSISPPKKHEQKQQENKGHHP